MHKVVIDTNIFVSGLATTNTPPGRILDLWRQGLFVLVTSQQLLTEVEEVLGRSEIMAFTGLSLEEIQAFLQHIRERSVITKGEYFLEPLISDPDDTIVLQAAVEGNASHIVTGDKKSLLPLKEFQNITIVSPQDFLFLFQR